MRPAHPDRPGHLEEQADKARGECGGEWWLNCGPCATAQGRSEWPCSSLEDLSGSAEAVVSRKPMPAWLDHLMVDAPACCSGPLF